MAFSKKNLFAGISVATMMLALGAAALHTNAPPRPVVDASTLKLHRVRGVYLLDGEPFSGVAEKHNARGTLIEQTDLDDGRRNGRHNKWFADGRLSYEGVYEDGRRHGVSRTWWKDGTLRSEARHNSGTAHGLQRQWYKSGAKFKEINLVEGREEGPQRSWRENGKLYNNYVARDRRIYGLKRSKLCFQLDDEVVQRGTP